jgi:nitrate/TMAO reductase-like tetraheme cytochrome c subunit
MVTMMVAGGVLGGWAASGDAGAPSALARTPAQECGSCHQEIYQQWQQSMHAKSTAIKDPVHAMMYASVMG